MNQVFSGMLCRDTDSKSTVEKRLGYMMWFCDTFPVTEFREEEYILRQFLEYCVKLEVPAKSKYFDVFLSLELRELLISTHIHVGGTEAISFDDPVGLATALEVTKQVMKDNYNELEEIEEDIEDFLVSADTFMVTRLNERLGEVLTRTFEMTSSSTLNAADYALDEISNLKYIYNRDSIEELRESRVEEKDDYEKITDSGIPFIDKDLGGVYRTQLGGVEAQPGTGKTRFALGTWVYRALTIYKKNVLFNALEQPKREIEAILVALHTFYLYGAMIDSKRILRKEIEGEEADKVKTARIDLFDSGKYGKLCVNEDTFYLETFIQRIRMLDRIKGPFDLIVIDYMGLMEQEPNNTTKYRQILQDYQVIGRSYRLYKRYARNSRKACIAIAQLNSKGTAAGDNDEVLDATMAQGGMEVYRNTDWNIAITMTPEMKLQHVRRFSQPKVRDSKGFGRQLCNTRLGYAYFFPKENVEI